jgi:dihydroorotate dehydrogenase electron transfer subunit
MRSMKDHSGVCCATSPFVQTLALITHHAASSTRYFLLRLRCEAIASRAQPGQFVMLACAPDDIGAVQPLLPRPLAILDARGDEIELLYFVAGTGTDLLWRSAEAAQHGAGPMNLRVIGPLGRGFTPIPGVDAHVALGGGSGMAPLVFFFRRFAQSSVGQTFLSAEHTRQAGMPVPPAWHLILAARTAEHLPNDAAVGAPGNVHRATDDGTAGFRGNAVEALRALLDGELKGKRVGIYAAGPEPMMRGAAQVARQHGLPCRVSLEQRMACGVGVCRACVVDGCSAHAKTGLLRRTVCQDGPVFDIDELAGW